MSIQSEEWISVQEELPQENLIVLAFNKYNTKRCFLRDGEWVDMNDHAVPYVTHWMPLPLPPKDK